jgi:hypothetical protein
MASMFARMYFRAASGRIALFAGFIGLSILIVHFGDQPPTLAELKVIDGAVENIRVQESFKGSKDIILITGTSGGREELKYFLNPGDDSGQRLTNLTGQPIRAWVEETYEKRIYQLESGNQRIIDYELRRKQIAGDPLVLSIYFAACLAVFAVISVKRFREQKGAND